MHSYMHIAALLALACKPLHHDDVLVARQGKSGVAKSKRAARKARRRRGAR